jgi:hypothetical protein
MVRNRADDKEERVVRAKWTMDESETMDEMAEKLEQKAEYIRDLKEEGWELEDSVQDDYAILVRDEE